MEIWMEIMAFILSVVTCISVIASIYFGFRKLNNIEHEFLLNKRYQDARSNLPIFLMILEDLEVLYNLFAYDGIFCPDKEPRAIVLEGDNISERIFEYRLIGKRIIRNCREVIYSIPWEDLPNTLKICKNIKNLLFFKRKGQKSQLDIMLLHVIDKKGICIRNRKENYKIFKDELFKLKELLDEQLEKDLPNLYKNRSKRD